MAAAHKKDPYSKLKAYFDYLMKVTPAKKSVVVFSPPYLDSWGLGKKANYIDVIFVLRPPSPRFFANRQDPESCG